MPARFCRRSVLVAVFAAAASLAAAQPLLVVIDSPLDGQTYGTEITVRGVAGERNDANRIGTPVGAGTPVVWAVLGSGTSGETTTGGDGRFAFAVPTSSFSGNRELLVGVGGAPERYGTAVIEIRSQAYALRTRPPDLTIDTAWQVRAPVLSVSPEYPLFSTPEPPDVPFDSERDLALEEPRYAILPGRRNRLVPERVAEAERESRPEPPLWNRFPAPFDLSEVGLATLPAAIRPEILFPPPPTAPYLAIDAESLSDFYRDEVVIRGVVGDSGEIPITSLSIEELRYEVPGTDVRGEVFWDLFDGTFSIRLDTRSFSGQKKVLITALNSSGLERTEEVTLFDGSIKPEISFFSPGDGTPFGRAVRVTGRVVDPSPDRGQPRGIVSVRYEIYAEEVGTGSREVFGDVSLEPNGDFSIEFGTEGMFGDQVVHVIAGGVNGAESERRIVLIPGATDIPTFRSEPGDGEITLLWERVPGLKAYTVVMTGPAGQTEFHDVEPPFRVTDLVNGERYEFRLVGDGPGFAEPLTSDVVVNIPLSDRMLVPRVAGGYRRIDVEWTPVPGSADYDIFRSEAADGPFLRRARITGAEFTDRDVRFGADYYYRVAPAVKNALSSVAREGTSQLLPAEPLVSSALFPATGARATATLGDYVLFARDGGIDVIDVFDPVDPSVVAEIETVDVRAMTTFDTLLCVADGSAGIKVFDIQTPTAPELIGSVSADTVTDVAALGDLDADEFLLYTAGGREGIAVYRIDRYRAPERIEPGSEEVAVESLVFVGERLVGVGTAGLSVWSIDADGVPRLQSVDSALSAQSVAAMGTRLYLGSDDGVVAVEFDEAGETRTLVRVPLEGVREIAVRSVFDGRELIYVTASEGLAVFDMSDVSYPTPFGVFSASDASGVAVRDDVSGRPFAYLGNESGLTIVDVYVLGQSLTIGSARTPGNSVGVHALELPDGRRVAAVGDGVGGVRLYDVTDPDQGVSLIGRIPLERCRSATIAVHPERGPLVLAVDEFAGLLVYALEEVIATPPDAEPPLLAEVPGDGEIRSVFAGQPSVLEGRWVLAVADRRAGLVLMDATEIEDIFTVSSIELPRVDDVTLSGDTLFAADSRIGLVAVSVGADGTLTREAELPLRWARSVAVEGDTVAVVGEEGLSLATYESDAGRLSRLGLYRTEHAEDVVLRDTYAYLAEGIRGFRVIDVYNPARPLLVSGSDVPYAISVDELGEVAVIASGRGIEVVQILVPSWLTAR